MIMLILAVILAVCTFVAIDLQKTYSAVSVKELKRRASRGDDFAKLLHSVVVHDISLAMFLWLIIGLSAVGFFFVASASLPGWLAFFGAVILVWVGFAWLPRTEVSNFSLKIAQYITPALSWLLVRVGPFLAELAKTIKTRAANVSVHTGLYEKEDLLELLDSQNTQLDNRITDDELGYARSALVFNDKTVRECMTPTRVVTFVKEDDSIGPLLLDELHKSGFSRFPVQSNSGHDIVGTLYLRALVDKGIKGKVAGVMSKRVYYVNEAQTLPHVLRAFLKTKHHLFVVVNEFEEVSGVITIEDVIEQLIGKKIVDEFDKYDDLREVAALAAKKDQKKHAKPADEHQSNSQESSDESVKS